MVIVAGVAPIRPDRREEAVAAIQQVMELTRKEAGCLAFHLAFDAVDPNQVVVMEQWESHAAIDAHLQSAHLAAFFAQTAEFLAGPPQIQRHTVAESRPL